jgi:large repetitive protein
MCTKPTATSCCAPIRSRPPCSPVASRSCGPVTKRPSQQSCTNRACQEDPNRWDALKYTVASETTVQKIHDYEEGLKWTAAILGGVAIATPVVSACISNPLISYGCVSAAGAAGSQFNSIFTGGSEDADPGAFACGFTPTTKVLMAGGHTKAIGKIAPGDKVEAGSPLTGRHKGPRTVLARVVHHDDDLLDLTIRSAGRESTVHTTANHPSWDDTRRHRVPAGELKPGDQLESATDQHVTVVSAKAHPGAADMYNLSVQDLHTYYVVAGATPVLVHNTNCGPTVFRGTTKGFDGSPGTQRVGITPTSSDPGVATIFGTHSEQFGDSVVQIATPQDLAGVETYEGCIPSEAEVGVELSPSEFSSRASIEIPTSAAREILGRMGISIPSRIGIEDLSPLLASTPKLSPEQISQFVGEAGAYSG